MGPDVARELLKGEQTTQAGIISRVALEKGCK